MLEMSEYTPYQKFYLVSDQCLVKLGIEPKDLYNYLFHGFAIIELQDGSYYVNYAYPDQKLITIKKDEDSDKLFIQMNGENIFSKFIRLCVKINGLSIHKGDVPEAHETIKKILEDFHETYLAYQHTINFIICVKFPTYSI